MAGTKMGGMLAAETIKRKYGADFYSKIGATGGKAGHTGGFAAPVACVCAMVVGDHFIRQCAGLKGGTISRRRKVV